MLHQIPSLIQVNGSTFRMEKPHDELFDSVCDVRGHLFLDGYSEYDVDGEFDGNLYAKCTVCENLIKFWYYSPDMIDTIKSKELCC